MATFKPFGADPRTWRKLLELCRDGNTTAIKIYFEILYRFTKGESYDSSGDVIIIDNIRGD